MQADYIQRVNRAIDHVVRHLDQPIRLEELARLACFSPFHFHRIFRSLVGESLNQFVRRLRLEQALSMMTHEQHRSLTDIALSCGFSSSSDFSRTFKQRYGASPRAFDLDSFRKRNRQKLQAKSIAPGSRHLLDRIPAGQNPDGFTVEFCELPARTVAYIRVLNSFEGRGVIDAVERLVHWADSCGLAGGQWLGYMWDDPEVVALEDCRYDIAVEVEHAEPTEDVCLFEFPPMRVAQVKISGGVELELRALDWLFGTWLPNSCYLPTDQPNFEAFQGRPFAHGYDHFELKVQLPVKRASAMFDQ